MEHLLVIPAEGNKSSFASFDIMIRARTYKELLSVNLCFCALWLVEKNEKNHSECMVTKLT